jgi:hypothetical protein
MPGAVGAKLYMISQGCCIAACRHHRFCCFRWQFAVAVNMQGGCRHVAGFVSITKYAVHTKLCICSKATTVAVPLAPLQFTDICCICLLPVLLQGLTIPLTCLWPAPNH